MDKLEDAAIALAMLTLASPVVYFLLSPFIF